MIFKGKLTALDADGNPIQARPLFEGKQDVRIEPGAPVPGQGQIEFSMPIEIAQQLGLFPGLNWEDMVE